MPAGAPAAQVRPSGGGKRLGDPVEHEPGHCPGHRDRLHRARPVKREAALIPRHEDGPDEANIGARPGGLLRPGASLHGHAAQSRISR